MLPRTQGVLNCMPASGLEMHLQGPAPESEMVILKRQLQ